MSAPTGSQLIAYAMTQRGTPPGKVRENVNDYTQAYYGNNTAASWCLIFIWYCLRHFGADRLIGGKIAYVPYLKDRVGGKWHTPRSLIAKGDLVTYDFNHSGEPEHVGLFIRWLDSAHTRFEAIEGNTGNDVVAVRQRSWSDVYGYVKPGLAPEDPSRYPGKVYRYSPSHPVMHDSHVTWIQQRLGMHGHKVTADSYYGPSRMGDDHRVPGAPDRILIGSIMELRPSVRCPTVAVITPGRRSALLSLSFSRQAGHVRGSTCCHPCGLHGRG